MSNDFKIDTTQLTCFQSCPREYYNHYIRKIRKVKYDERNIHLDWGGRMHSGIETWHKTKDISKGATALDGFIGVPTNLIKTAPHGKLALQDFVSYWQQNFKDAKILSNEVVDAFDIGDIKYQVKSDLVIDFRDNIYAVDYKTTQSKGKGYYFNQFEPNTQVTANCDSVARRFGSCSGFIPVAIFVGFRKRMYKGEPAGFHCSIESTIINRTPQQIEDFRQNVIDTVSQLKKCLDSGRFPKHEKACHNYKGCSYKELCISCDDEQVAEVLYETFDPLEYLKEGEDEG